jgi:hypothetical protein
LKDLQKHSTVHDVFADYLHPYGGALAINWWMYHHGTSNRTIYAPIPLTKRFQYRDNEVHSILKTIVTSDDFGKVKNPHAVKKVRKEVAVPDTPTKPGGLQKQLVVVQAEQATATTTRRCCCLKLLPVYES